jgi:putative cell wall-binding protein
MLAVALLIPATASAATYTLGSTSAKGVQSLYGQNVWGTAAQVAKAAYPKGVPSKRAILVNYKSWQNALCAAPLAGAMDCPILYVGETSFPTLTKNALNALKVDTVLIVGSPENVTMTVVQKASKAGFKVNRLGTTSKTVYGTQMAIYDYGRKRNLWNSNTVFAVTGKSFTDALSISPLAFKYKIPIFLVNPNGTLTTAQSRALSNGKITRIWTIGGEKAVNATAYKRLTTIAKNNAKAAGKVASIDRIWGANAYSTSAEVAKWSVKRNYLKWDRSAFARCKDSADALAGSVLQGKESAALLVIEPENETTLKTLKGKGAKVVKIFGGVKAISSGVRADITYELGWGPKTGHRVMGTSPSFTQAKFVRAYKATGHSYPDALKKKGAKNIEEFCKILVTEANAEGVKPELVYAMTMFETGWLTSSNAKNKCNFCGLGGGGSAALPFDNVRAGLRAQIQHMKLYASKDPLAKPAAYERWAQTAKWMGRGFAPTVEELGVRWAGMSDYYDHLEPIINRVKRA